MHTSWCVRNTYQVKYEPKPRHVNTSRPRLPAQQTKRTAPRAATPARNSLSASKLRSEMTISPLLQDWDQQRRTHSQLCHLKKCTLYAAGPKEISWCGRVAVPLLQGAAGCRQNPAPPSLVSPYSNVGVCCLDNAARFQEDREWARTRPCGTRDSKNYWALLQHVWAQARKNSRSRSPPHLPHLVGLLGPHSPSRLTHFRLIPACVTSVSWPGNNVWWSLFDSLQTA